MFPPASATPPATGVSVRKFAKLEGCSHTLVNRAVKAGKLPIFPDGTISARLVGSAWRPENRRRAGGGNSGGNKGGNSAENVSSVSTSAGASISLDHGDDGPVRFADLTTEDAERFVSDILNGQFRSLAEAEKAKANALDAKHLIAALRDSRSVVSRAKAEDALFEQIRVARDAFLGWPSKIAPLIAASLEVDADRLRYELDEHMWTQLEDLRSMEAIDFDEGTEG